MRGIVLAVSCSACASAPATDNFGTPFHQSIPTDVRAFIIDAQACTHFGGEGPTGDPQRDRFLAGMVEKTCTGIGQRKAQLLKRHRNSDPVRAAIAEAWEE